jgi:hypothetical protein
MSTIRNEKRGNPHSVMANKSFVVGIHDMLHVDTIGSNTCRNGDVAFRCGCVARQFSLALISVRIKKVLIMTLLFRIANTSHCGRGGAQLAALRGNVSNPALFRVQDEGALPQDICRVIVEEAGSRVGRAEHDGLRTVTPVAGNLPAE